MKITYDKQIDAMYLYFAKGKIKKTVVINPRVVVDIGEKGKVVGIELLFVSEKMSRGVLRSKTIHIPTLVS